MSDSLHVVDTKWLARVDICSQRARVAQLARELRAGCCTYAAVITKLSSMRTNESASTKKPRTTTAIRFPEELHGRLREAAQDFGLPVNFLVVKAMEEFLDRMIDPSEFTLTRSTSS